MNEGDDWRNNGIILPGDILSNRFRKQPRQISSLCSSITEVINLVLGEVSRMCQEPCGSAWLSRLKKVPVSEQAPNFRTLKIKLGGLTLCYKSS